MRSGRRGAFDPALTVFMRQSPRSSATVAPTRIREARRSLPYPRFALQSAAEEPPLRQRKWHSPLAAVLTCEITHWCSVPSVISFARRMRSLRPGSMPTLRHSLFAGEPLTLQQAEVWQAAAPLSALDMLYGPTELTVTCFRLPGDPDDQPPTTNGTVPI
jgi:hypothetical protein